MSLSSKQVTKQSLAGRNVRIQGGPFDQQIGHCIDHSGERPRVALHSPETQRVMIDMSSDGRNAWVEADGTELDVLVDAQSSAVSSPTRCPHGYPIELAVCSLRSCPGGYASAART